MSNDIVIIDNKNTGKPVQESQNSIMQPAGSNITLHVFLGLFALLALFGGAGYWALSAQLDGAIVAPASFVVESNRKTVQHLEGGIIKDLLVKEGDYVEANQVLLYMDATSDEVNLDVLGNQLAELYVRRARLTAELSGADVFEFNINHYPIIERLPANVQSSLLSVQKSLFEEQLQARKGEAEVVEQRILRFQEEVAGLGNQRDGTHRQIAIIDKEIKSFEELLRRKLIAGSRVNALKRERERLLVSDAQFETGQARALNQISELTLSVIGDKRLRREAIATELATIATQISSISPQYFGAEQKLQRVAVMAPVSGRIVNMQVYTNGGVLRAGDTILDIVPQSDELVVEARIATADIEKLYVGQDTRVRLSAFDQTDVPEASGEIIGLSADSLTDERSGARYYVARVRLGEDQPAVVRDLDFVPGMPADVFINTGDRTAFSYFLKPLNDRLARTFVQ